MFKNVPVIFAILYALTFSCYAQKASEAPAAPAEPGIQDNSFLVEEAYNQEFGVVQHIQSVQRMWPSGAWVYSFTQEWPVQFDPHHQLSFTVPVVGQDAQVTQFGDIALNYRYQLVGNGETKVAFSPRFSLLLPTGNSRAGTGAGGTGLQFNLPLSVVHTTRLTTHWNVGTTITPHQKNELGDKAKTVGVNLGQSFIWNFNHRLNGMLETVWASTESVVARDKTVRQQSLLVSPGVRWAYNLKSGMQIVPGIGIPVGVGPSRGDWGVLFYFSIEHPFRKLAKE